MDNLLNLIGVDNLFNLPETPELIFLPLEYCSRIGSFYLDFLSLCVDLPAATLDFYLMVQDD